jgi:Flp pilus assembly protein TadD
VKTLARPLHPTAPAPPGDRQSGAFAGRGVWHFAPLFVAAVVLLVFLPASRFEFLTWDDPAYVTRNPLVMGGITGRKLLDGLAAVVMCNWAPLTILSYQLDAALFGPGPFGFHLTNVVLHAAACGLLGLALWRMTGAAGKSTAAALVFGVHPLRVESVAWVSERKDVLSVFFLALALLAYDWFTRRPGIGRYLAVVAAMAASLASKATLVTLPVLLLLCDAWPLGRIAADRLTSWLPRPSADPPRMVVSFRRAILEKLPLFAVAIAFTWITVLAQGVALKGNVNRSLLGQRLPNAVFATGWYLWRFFIPANLIPYYSPIDPGEAASWVAISAAACLVLMAIAVATVRSRPSFAWGMAWFFVSLLPVAQIVQTGQHGYADRYSYIPHLGLCVAVVWAVADLLKSVRAPALVGPVAAMLVTITAVAVTRPLLMHWRSEETLWEHALAVDPGNFHCHYQLGCARLRARDFDAAERHLRVALRGYDGVGLVAARLAGVYAEMGDFFRARRCIDRAIMTMPEDEATQWGIDRLQAALDARPRSEATRDLVRNGLSAARSGDFRTALGHFTRAAAEDPAAVEPCTNAGLACLEGGDATEARRWFERAVDNDPFNADCRVNLAKLLVARGELVTAIMHADIASRIDPDDREARVVRDDAVKRNGGPPGRVEFNLDALPP